MPSLNRTVARALVVSLCTMGLPIPVAQAELVATDRVEATRQDGRKLLSSLFDRADVRAALDRQGVSPDEAKARVAALSDDEAERLAARFDAPPAAGRRPETALVTRVAVYPALGTTVSLRSIKVRCST